MRSLCSSVVLYPTGFRGAGAKSETIIGVRGVIDQLALNVFGKRPVRIRMQGVVGAEG